MFNEHIHGPFDRIECNVSYPSRYSCSPSASLGLHYNFEGGIGFLMTRYKLAQIDEKYAPQTVASSTYPPVHQQKLLGPYSLEERC
jgi:hypothetical protein